MPATAVYLNRDSLTEPRWLISRQTHLHTSSYFPLCSFDSRDSWHVSSSQKDMVKGFCLLISAFQSSYFKHHFNYYSWPVFFQQWLCNIYILLLPLYAVSVIVAGGVRLSSASFRLSTHAQATMHNTTECTRSC